VKIKTPDGTHDILAIGNDKTGTFVMVENAESLATLWHRTQLPESSRKILDGLVTKSAGYKVTLGDRITRDGFIPAYLKAV